MSVVDLGAVEAISRHPAVRGSKPLPELHLGRDTVPNGSADTPGPRLRKGTVELNRGDEARPNRREADGFYRIDEVATAPAVMPPV